MPKNTGDETKSEIKLNRKMRMWNKYRNYFITGVVIVIVLIVQEKRKTILNQQ